jgi:large subunit ribosomal protein L4e
LKAAVNNVILEVIQEEVEAGPLAEVYDLSVEQKGKVNLPSAFESDVRADLIRRAVHSSRANRRQPYGSHVHIGKRRPMPGMKHSVEWWGKGRGVARIMRRTGQSRGAQDPRTKGGRRAHGPKVESERGLAMNRTERRAARNSAIAATAQIEMVSARGHQFVEDIKSLPIILGDYTEVKDGKKSKIDIEAFTLEHPTRKLVTILEGLGLGDDLIRAKKGRKVRPGKGKMRSRRFKQPKSLLLVVEQKDGLARAAHNLPGVDVVSVRDLSAEHLAPGGDAGRLTVFTKKAIAAME